jgi:hypothetical protein
MILNYLLSFEIIDNSSVAQSAKRVAVNPASGGIAGPNI